MVTDVLKRDLIVVHESIKMKKDPSIFWIMS